MDLFSQFLSLANLLELKKVISRTFTFTCVQQNTSHIGSVGRRRGSTLFVIFIQDPCVWIKTILVVKIKDGFLALSVVVQPIDIKHVKVAAVEPGGKPSASIIRPLKFRKLFLQAAFRQLQKGKGDDKHWEAVFQVRDFTKQKIIKKKPPQCC